MRLSIVRGVALLLLAGGANADPSVPWMPSQFARHNLELLVDDAGLGLPLSQWPLPRAAVVDAIGRLSRDLPEDLDTARRQVLSELDAQLGGRVSIAIRSTGETLSGFGDDATPGSSATLRTGLLGSEWVAGQIGARVERAAPGSTSAEALRLDGSAPATEAVGVQLQVWSHKSWWTPGWQNGLTLSNNAPSLNAIGLQRSSASPSQSVFLSWLGPWNFEFFIGQLQDVKVPAHPYLVGNRLTFKPFANLELALTRMAQWGGEGRSQSLASFADMLTGKGVNADTAAQQARDPANEEAGFDVRLRCPWARCATYAQLIGEDQAGILPSHYLGMYGFESWSADGSNRWFAEYAETGCHTPIGRAAIKGCAYRNFAYPGGYVQSGRWIGSSAGPDSRLLTLGWLNAPSETSMRFQYGSIGSRIGTFSPLVDDPETSGHLVGLSAKRTFHWHAVSFEPEVSFIHVKAPIDNRNEVRIGASVSASGFDRMPMPAEAAGFPFPAAGSVSDTDPSPRTGILR